MGVGAWRSMPEARRARVAAAMRSVPAEWDAILMDPTPLSAFAALDMPILLITGSESPTSSKEVARLLAKNLPLVTLVEIEGVGHMGPVTHANQVNALIAGHLERHHERTTWCGRAVSPGATNNRSLTSTARPRTSECSGGSTFDCQSRLAIRTELSKE
jgi:hypothetical protein